MNLLKEIWKKDKSSCIVVIFIIAIGLLAGTTSGVFLSKATYKEQTYPPTAIK